MPRIVLVEWSPGDWRVVRQSHWIGEVRRRPEAAVLPRSHWELAEEAFRTLRGTWAASTAGLGVEQARRALVAAGAVEVPGPG